MRFRRPLDIVVAVYELITIDELGAVSFGLRGQLGGWRIKREIPQINAPSQSAHPRILNLINFIWLFLEKKIKLYFHKFWVSLHSFISCIT